MQKIRYRWMSVEELGRLAEIRRAEHIRVGYEMHKGALLSNEVDWDVPDWFEDEDGDHTINDQIKFCRSHLDAGGQMIGAFGDGKLVGVGIITTGIRPSLAQLAYMHVSHDYRRQGIAKRLAEKMIKEARNSGAERLYVSATPSGSAVDFYLSQGFAPVAEPLPELFEMEPEDIHMVKALNPNSQYSTSKNLDARIALHQAYTPPGRDFWDFAWTNYDFSEVEHLLEVGCGSGAFWTHNADNLSRSVDLLLSDKSKGMLESARDNLSRAGIGANFQQADVEKLPFFTAVFDAVLAQFMLYHAASQEGALREISRVLRNGGWAGVVLTQPGHMDEIFSVMRQIDPSSAPLFDSDLFTSEHGASLLKIVFREVKRYDYKFQMQVTDPEMLTRYAEGSLEGIRFLPASYWNEYSEIVSSEISSNGYFTVTKQCTLFICRV